MSSWIQKGHHWPWILVGLFVITGLANGLLLIKATGDPSHAVVPDYYEKALTWDRQMEQQRLNQELGWQVGLELTVTEEATLRVQITLTDARGQPIRGAGVQLSALHKARASQVFRVTTTQLAGGIYVATLPARRPGLWQLSLEATRGGQRFTRVMEREVPRRLTRVVRP